MLEALQAIAEATYPYPRSPTDSTDPNYREWGDVAHYIYVELVFKATPATLLAQFEMNGYTGSELVYLHRLLNEIANAMPLQETALEKETREKKLAAFNAERQRSRETLKKMEDLDQQIYHLHRVSK